MKYFYLTLFTIITINLGFAQTTYNGNGNTGFGGVIGPGSLIIDDDGTTITFEITRGSGQFFDALVLYIDSTTGGRSAIDGDVNDTQDPLRNAISSAGANASALTFPAGFEADYALAVDTSFGGLWAIPATNPVGDGELAFVDSANSTLSMASDTSFTLEVDWAELGITSADGFKFIGIYLNAGNGFTSDEAFGSDIPGGNLGSNDFTFLSNFEYGNTLSTDQFEAGQNIRVVNNTLEIKDYIGSLRLNVYDITGKLIREIDTYSQSNFETIPLDLSSQQIYLLNIEGSDFSKTMKVIIR
ncbi:MAG: T9SS type A sorting domain-containing protein [Psychroserpens sp.]|nr:T9SS type A sorting domain-containing protein [Psychroserpens sp.]